MSYDPGYPPSDRPDYPAPDPGYPNYPSYPTAAGYPQAPPTQYAYAPPPPRSKAVPIAVSICGALLLAGIGIALFIFFGPHANEPPQPVAALTQTPITTPQAAPRTVGNRPEPSPAPQTVPETPAPPPLIDNGGPGTTGSGTSPGAYDTNGDAVAFDCSTDGVHLYSTVQINNTSSASWDFVGTMEFVDEAGNYLGTGGFSAADLAGGESIEAYVDTGDPNDPRASQRDLSGVFGPVGCIISDLHSK